MTNYEKKCDLIFSEIIKLRDCKKTTGSPHFGRCCTCGRLFDDALVDCGHFIEGRHPSVKFDLRNAHLQCGLCNRINKGTNEYKEMRKAYKTYMLINYGQEVIDELERMNNEITHYKEFHYKTMYDQFKVILKDLKK